MFWSHEALKQFYKLRLSQYKVTWGKRKSKQFPTKFQYEHLKSPMKHCQLYAELKLNTRLPFYRVLKKKQDKEKF